MCSHAEEIPRRGAGPCWIRVMTLEPEGPRAVAKRWPVDVPTRNAHPKLMLMEVQHECSTDRESCCWRSESSC